MSDQTSEFGNLKSLTIDHEVHSVRRYLYNIRNIIADFDVELKEDENDIFPDIPVELWNKAIEVIKNIITSTRSIDRAFRVTSTFIQDNGYDTVQATKFEQSVKQGLEIVVGLNSISLPDNDEAMKIEGLVYGANRLKEDFKGRLNELDTDEFGELQTAFSCIHLESLNKKELYNYVELSSVLLADPEMVSENELIVFFNSLFLRQFPKQINSLFDESYDCPEGEQSSKPSFMEYWSTRNVLNNTIVKAISHLIKNVSDFKIDENGLYVLTLTLLILKKLPRLMIKSPAIHIEIHYPERSFSGYYLDLYGNNIVIGVSREDVNEYGLCHWRDPFLDLDLVNFSETILFEEFTGLKVWTESFINSNFDCEVSIDCDRGWYDDTDFYDPTEDNEEDEGFAGEEETEVR